MNPLTFFAFTRYFVLELTPPNEKTRTRLDVSDDAIYRAVLEVVSQIHGDYGVSSVRTRLIGAFLWAVIGACICNLRPVSFQPLSNVTNVLFLLLIAFR